MILDCGLKLVALTLGEKGSRLASSSEVSFLEAMKVPVVDTVGAGDAFTAALTMGLLQRLPLRVIHENATRLRALCVHITGRFRNGCHSGLYGILLKRVSYSGACILWMDEL